jgi:hypothetical protein
VEHATVSLIPPSVSCSNNNPQDLDARTFCPQPPLSREDELGWQEHVDGPLDCSQYSTATVLDVDMGSVLNLGRLLEAVSTREDRCRVGVIMPYRPAAVYVTFQFEATLSSCLFFVMMFN